MWSLYSRKPLCSSAQGFLLLLDLEIQMLDRFKYKYNLEPRKHISPCLRAKSSLRESAQVDSPSQGEEPGAAARMGHLPRTQPNSAAPAHVPSLCCTIRRPAHLQQQHLHPVREMCPSLPTHKPGTWQAGFAPGLILQPRQGLHSHTGPHPLQAQGSVRVNSP